MRRIIFALLISISSTLAFGAANAQPKKPLELAAGAPDRHVVVAGDTLWGLSAKFLKDPYRWSDLWKMNAADVKDPHRIYPGQVLVLDRSGAQPTLGLETVKLSPREYIEMNKKEIPSISPTVIEPFLTEALVLDQAGMADAPRVVALADGRVVAGAGDKIYTTPVTATDKLWQVFRPGAPLVDAGTGEVLGHEALFLGTARLRQAGSPTEFQLLTSKLEIVADDRLLVAPRADVPSYLPHAPDTQIKGHVLGMPGGVRFGGMNTVISINRGKADGLERGHVLAIETAGMVVNDRGGDGVTQYKLPDSRNGLIFVFRVFERVSYALVMSSDRPISVGDVVRTP